MASILLIAQDVADRLSLDEISTLYGPVDQGNTTARRLRSAITDTCEYLRANYDWQQSRREHVFLTQPTEQQPGAIPADFSRFVQGSMYDRSRKMPLMMAESDADWAAARGFPIGAWDTRWVRRGNDIWLAPWNVGGLEISFEYHSDAIGEAPAVAHTVVNSTDGMVLAINSRVIVRSGHTVTFPVMGPADSVEMVPQGGLWVNLGCSFNTATGAPIENRCPAGYADWISVVKDGMGYVLKPRFGHWAEISVATTNGMTLEATRRYVCQQGHILYLPVLAAGEQIEVVAATGSWGNAHVRFVTRDGLELTHAHPNNSYDGMAVITADMRFIPAYEAIDDGSMAPPTARSRTISRFSADTDVALWDDDLVRLGTIWHMKYADGLPYAEDFRAFQMRIYDKVKGAEGHGMVDFGGQKNTRRPIRRALPIVVEGQERWSQFE